MTAAKRVDALRSWHQDWKGVRAAVLGLGMTGFSAADTLTELGCEVRVFARTASSERVQLTQVIGASLTLETDDAVAADAIEAFAPDVVIVSPGYHPDNPLLERVASLGITVWGDIELAWRLRDKVEGRVAEWITVTGTNGKTTTVGLTAAMLRADGRRVAACGNIGVPVLDAIRDPEGFDVLVVELSSYQLHWMRGVSPLASACLNLADDHIDWHGSREAYAAAKGHVYDDTRIACVYNLGDNATRMMVENADVIDGARAIGFGLGVPGPSDFGIVDGILVDRAFLEERRDSALEITTVDQLAAAGLAAPHIVMNVLAACALVRAADVPIPAIRRALADFRLDPHRIELVATHAGVRWIDDSKATNPHAADASLGAFDDVVWVVGGLLKGVEIDSLVRDRRTRLRAAVVIGVERSDVLAAFERHAPEVPVLEVVPSDTETVMRQVVRLATTVAREGDVVLLAPAAASMDQFDDYGHRGTEFATAVRDMVAQAPDAGSAHDEGADHDRDAPGATPDSGDGTEPEREPDTR